jgi:hypothetical protein
MEHEQDKVFLEDKVILRPRILFDGSKNHQIFEYNHQRKIFTAQCFPGTKYSKSLGQGRNIYTK